MKKSKSMNRINIKDFNRLTQLKKCCNNSTDDFEYKMNVK